MDENLSDRYTSLLPDPDVSQRLCIFCGERPAEKTREDVIPRWIQTKVFGDDFKIPVMQANRDIRMTALNEFVAPACRRCNNVDLGGNLDDPALEVITRLWNHEFINATEAIALLDWFDRLRIGINEAALRRCKIAQFSHWTIKARIGRYDRCLYIGRCNKTKDHWGALWPPHDLLFLLHPSFFHIQLRNLSFISISGPNLCAQQLGLYRLANVQEVGNGVLVSRMAPMKRRPRKPEWFLKPEQFSMIAQACGFTNDMQKYDDTTHAWKPVIDENEDQNTEKFWSPPHIVSSGSIKEIGSKRVNVLPKQAMSNETLVQTSNNMMHKLRTNVIRKQLTARGNPFMKDVHARIKRFEFSGISD